MINPANLRPDQTANGFGQRIGFTGLFRDFLHVGKNLGDDLGLAIYPKGRKPTLEYSALQKQNSISSG